MKIDWQKLIDDGVLTNNELERYEYLTGLHPLDSEDAGELSAIRFVNEITARIDKYLEN